MSETRSSTFGKIFTAITIFCFSAELLACLATLFKGSKKITLYGISLYTKGYYGKFATGLTATQALLGIAACAYIWAKRDFLSTKAPAKLSVFLVLGAMMAGAEWCVYKGSKAKSSTPMSWVGYAILYCLYTFVPACRPWRPTKQSSYA